MADLAGAGKRSLDPAAGGRRFGVPALGGGFGETRSLSRVRAQQKLAVIVLGCVLALGFFVRLIAAMTLSPHVDEPSSLLAAHAVADRWLPILPSGTVYFQGATLSYLLQPFIWLGLGDLGDLRVMRSLLVVAGTITLYLCYRLGRLVTGDARVGLLMAALVAIDPLSVQWSGHLRMYGLLQTLTVGLAWAYIAMLIRGPSLRQAGIVVALFWAAVFTHVGAALLGPAMALAALVMYRRSLFRRWHLLGCLAMCALAPATLLTLNQSLGTSSVSQREESSSSSILTFVGDNLLAPLARFQVSPSEWNWASVVQADNLFWWVPGLIVAVSAVIAGRLLLRGNGAQLSSGIRHAVITLLSFYWLPMVAVGVFTVSPKERYLLNVHILGYLFLAVLVIRVSGQHVIRGADARNRGARLAGVAASVAVVLVIGFFLVWRLENPVVHPNHNAAMAYVAERHEPGEPVIVALPAIADLALDDSDRDDLYFLAGPQDQPRAQRYTRLVGDGELIDYWVGVNSIVSSEQLRVLLLEYPDAWVVVDEQRLNADWAYAGAIQRLLNDMTRPVLRTEGGGLVLRANPTAGSPTLDEYGDVVLHRAPTPDAFVAMSPAQPVRSERSLPTTGQRLNSRA